MIDRAMVVGASADADLVIEDAAVSGFHAELDPRDDGLWIRDLGSLNGTFVGGVRVRETSVSSQASITIGGTVLQVDYEQGPSLPIELWRTDTFHSLVGQSPIMRELFAYLARVSPSDASVLIRGETGTGKELVARSIHESSLRSQGPFVVVDCAALPENLLDAELFGHAKGAFTGANTVREGAIESANGGTVFLDEIGEVPLAMQPKLLRVLEQHTVRRLGESHHRKVDVRFVSATHRDLLAMVAQGRFREDLYFRLAVLPVVVPALRQRREDIELLVRYFAGGAELSPAFVEELSKMPWRGNVRELRNAVERARALGEAKVGAQLRPSFGAETPTSVGRRRAPTQRPPAFGDMPRPSSMRSTSALHETTKKRETGPQDAPPAAAAPAAAAAAVPAPAPVPVAVAGAGALASAMPLPGSAPPEGAAPSHAPPLTSVVQGLSGVPTGVPFEGDFRAFREKWIELGEREYLKNMMAKHRDRVPAVSEEAGVNRTYIYRLIRKYGLQS
ncbi:MAG: sigma 54-interacting transcriptional regulator [Labilithrix sp.]|nr:sigma 54-interacting transcriptional regulator [Labilithrix sp.]MCW5809956.1 sigma 54-interacting transcriptional regulator [Labilithrix sp.]